MEELPPAVSLPPHKYNRMVDVFCLVFLIGEENSSATMTRVSYNVLVEKLQPVSYGDSIN